MHYEALDPHLNLFRRFGLPPGSQELRKQRNSCAD